MVALGDGVGIALGVGVGVGFAIGVSVGVGIGVACGMDTPLSQTNFFPDLMQVYVLFRYGTF